MTKTFQILQHVPFEGPANIGKWVTENNYKLAYTRLYNNDPLPALSDFDILVVMGGPMSVNDSDSLIWMQNEIMFISQAINSGKPVLGICLGAQFIAKALNGKAYKGENKEIGWFPINIKNNSIPEDISASFPEEIYTFHWHGDTFDIPDGALPLCSSAGTPNQGFIFSKMVWGLQFHLEMNSESIISMLKHCSDDITEGTYIQTPAEMQQGLINEIDNYSLLSSILSYLSRRIN